MATKPVFVDVLPNLAGFGSLLLGGTTDAASKAGRSAGDAWSRSMAAASKSDVLKSQVAALQEAESKAKRAVQDATRDIAKARDAAAVAAKNEQAAEKRLDEQVEKYGPSSSQAIKAEAQLEAARAKVRQTTERVDASEKALKASKNATKETTEQLTKANKELAKATEEQPSRWASFGSSLEGVNAKSGMLRRTWDKARGSLKLLGVGIGAVGLAQWMKTSADATETFQKQMNLLVTAGGESTSQLGRVEQGIKDIAVQTGISTSQLAEGMYTMEKAQLRGADGLKVLKAAAQGATDEQVDLGVMTNALTSIMRSYNIPAGKASSVTNQLVAASGEAKTTMQEFAGSLSTVLPVASAAGISFDQVGGAIATLTSHGTSAQESTQELSNTIRSLQAPNQVAVKEMQQFGISSVDVAQNLGKRGLTGTIGYLSETILQKMGPSGTVLLDAFNQSKFAAQDAATMFGKLTGKSKELAKGVMDGSVTLQDYRQGLKALPDQQAALVRQWEQMYTKSKGFNDQLKQGSPQAQTYTEALKKIMGGATGMNTALMLSGGSTKTFANNVKGISDAAKQNGQDISTWAETQKTAKVQTDRFNQVLDTSRITMASKFLPAITNTMRGLTNGAVAIGDFTSKHKVLVGAMGGVAGALALTVAGVKAYIAITKAGTAANIIFTNGMKLLKAAFISSPWGWVVIVIGAIVAAIIAAYNHIKPFHDFVNKMFSGIKNIAMSVGKWFSGPFVNFFKSAWGAIKAGAQGFWNFLKIVFNGIGKIFKFAITLYGTIFFTPFVIAFNLLKKPVMDLWHKVIQPAFVGIKDIMHAEWGWIDAHVLKPFKDGLSMLGKSMSAVWNETIRPVWDWIRDKFSTTWNWIKDHVITAWNNEIRGWARIFHWLYDNAISPVWDWIRDKSSAAWNWISEHVFAPFKQGIHDIGQAFETTKDWIGRSWDMIKDAAAKPVHWVVDTVYTKGIQGVWNTIAGKVGLDLKLPDAPMFADGGINPGYAPGQDSILALTSPGEAWMVPEWTRAVGADNINRWNRLARQAGPAAVRADMGFSVGGVVQGFDLGGIVDSAKDWLSNAAHNVADFFADPGGVISRMILDPVRNAIKGAAGGDWGQLVGQMPIKVAGQLVQKAKDAVSKLLNAGGGGGGVERWRPLVSQALRMLGQPDSWTDTVLRRMNQESGGNPGAINKWDSNAKAGMPSQGLMQVIPPTFAAYSGPFAGKPITDPLANIYAGLNYAIHRYGSLSALDRPGGYADGGVVPSLYDKGGWLRPGTTVVSNQTGSPELVLTPEQQSRLFDKDDRSRETNVERTAPMIVNITNNGVKDPYVTGTITGRTAARQLRASKMGVS
ncbi:phage tail tape measure protein [Bifidobacterium xylocopae]|uniref:Phage tail tape measure protein n=1 Tax=Bifidobacterium xylocopae TaxID=2493119 RepID=A0A366KES5_9BIFI|nr:phage tail tape measure protein [Bifidobacterium xylocopae]RBQ00070.1 phage tail tape measure protein [Bifidobacterium xylocopae]